MNELVKSITAANSLSLPSAAKHILLLLLARQAEGEQGWPGYEALALDSSIPAGLVEKSIVTLRQKGLLRVMRSNGCAVHEFKVFTRTLQEVAFGG